jgi:hypothetical protein
MTRPKDYCSRQRFGAWKGELSKPIAVPRDATPAQMLGAAREFDKRMQLLAARYGVDLSAPHGWQMLATCLAADAVPGMWMESRGRNQSAPRKTPAYWRDLALAMAWRERTYSGRGAKADVARFLAGQETGDEKKFEALTLQFQNDLAKLDDSALKAARQIVDDFFRSHPERDDAFS